MNLQMFQLRFEKLDIKGNQRKGTGWSTESLSNSVSQLGLLGISSASFKTDTAISFHLLWLQTHRACALTKKMICIQFELNADFLMLLHVSSYPSVSISPSFSFPFQKCMSPYVASFSEFPDTPQWRAKLSSAFSGGFHECMLQYLHSLTL